VKGRALVVQQSRQDGLARTGPATDLVGRLQHGHLDTFPGQGSGGGEPVGPTADHDRGAHVSNPSYWEVACVGVAPRDHVTRVGIGPFGSHGCSFTASATFQVPRSITPRAASMTLYS
jgi:hypothetical protein